MLKSLFQGTIRTKLMASPQYFLEGRGYKISTHKISYGQGGYCSLNLVKYKYNIKFETIWEDFCNLQFKDQNSIQRVKIEEKQNLASITDNQNFTPVSQQNEQVVFQFQIPQDFTFYGTVNGTISHLKSNVSNKLRTNKMNLKLLGENSSFQWGSLQCPQLDIQADKGSIDIKNLTFENGKMKCSYFNSAKVLFSGHFDLYASENSTIRSVVTYGEAEAMIRSSSINIESISGKFKLEGEKVKVDRIWASPDGIDIKCKRVQGKMVVESGGGSIQSEEPINLQSIILGKIHKGRINKIRSNKIIIS